MPLFPSQTADSLRTIQVVASKQLDLQSSAQPVGGTLEGWEEAGHPSALDSLSSPAMQKLHSGRNSAAGAAPVSLFQVQIQ